MKQITMFGTEEETSENRYSKKIKAPIYEPKNTKPHLINTFDNTKTKQLIEKINASGLREDEKEFLRIAASRHTVFNYEVIADYYAHSLPEMQQLMEDSALIIIDFDKAIENGFVKLSTEIEDQFRTEHSKEVVSE